jgi:hypothetical protein
MLALAVLRNNQNAAGVLLRRHGENEATDIFSV